MGENLASHEHVRIPAHHGSAALRLNAYKDKRYRDVGLICLQLLRIVVQKAMVCCKARTMIALYTAKSLISDGKAVADARTGTTQLLFRYFGPI